MQEHSDMPNSDVQQVIELLSQLSAEFKTVKEFLLRHTSKIESIDSLLLRISHLETEIAVLKTNARNALQNSPSYHTTLLAVGWLLMFGLLLFQTFFE